MRKVMVRYRTKPVHAAENERLIADVFAQLHREAPEGLRYASFKADDGVSFTHFAIVESGERNVLPELDAFKAFASDIAERCDEPPVVTDLSEVGSYRFPG